MYHAVKRGVSLGRFSVSRCGLNALGEVFLDKGIWIFTRENPPISRLRRGIFRILALRSHVPVVPSRRVSCFCRASVRPFLVCN